MSPNEFKIAKYVICAAACILTLTLAAIVVNKRADVEIETQHRVEKTKIDAESRVEQEKIRQEAKTKRAQEWVKALPWNKE